MMDRKGQAIFSDRMGTVGGSGKTHLTRPVLTTFQNRIEASDSPPDGDGLRIAAGPPGSPLPHSGPSPPGPPRTLPTISASRSRRHRPQSSDEAARVRHRPPASAADGRFVPLRRPACRLRHRRRGRPHRRPTAKVVLPGRQASRAVGDHLRSHRPHLRQRQRPTRPGPEHEHRKIKTIRHIPNKAWNGGKVRTRIGYSPENITLIRYPQSRLSNETVRGHKRLQKCHKNHPFPRQCDTRTATWTTCLPHPA